MVCMGGKRRAEYPTALTDCFVFNRSECLRGGGDAAGETGEGGTCDRGGEADMERVANGAAGLWNTVIWYRKCLAENKNYTVQKVSSPRLPRMDYGTVTCDLFWAVCSSSFFMLLLLRDKSAPCCTSAGILHLHRSVCACGRQVEAVRAGAVRSRGKHQGP